MKVDSKGRIVLPKEFRERFGLDPGSEVTVGYSDGRLVVVPEDDPDEIIADVKRLVASAADSPDRTPAPNLGPLASDHVESIRRQSDDRDGAE